MKKESIILKKWENMPNVSGFMVTLVFTVIITALTITIDFLYVLLSSGKDGLRYCFFKAIYFNSVTLADGTISMSFGMTENYKPIIVFFAICFLFLFCTYTFTKSLLKYRTYLLNKG